METLRYLAALVDQIDPRISSFLELFHDPNVPIRVSVAIISVALLVLVLLLIWMVVVSVRIFILYRGLKALGKDETFAASFPLADEAMSKSLFSSAWIEYRKCILPTGDTIGYLRPPDEYIGLHAISSRSFPSRFFSAAHGYFVGVGLLMTFIGLVAALKFAAVGVASPDVAVAKEALNSLLSAASFKFMTSIAGLGCSLFLSVFVRIAIYVVESVAHLVAADLQRAMHPVVAERLAFDQLTASRDQLLQLEKFNTTFAVSLASEIDNRLKTTLGTAMEPVLTAIAAMPDPVVAELQAVKGEMKAVNHDAMQQILQEFLKELRGSTGAEFESVVSQLKDVVAAIGKANDKIGNSGESFADQMTQASTRLLTAADKLHSGLDGRVDLVGDKIAALADALVDSQQRLASSATGAADDLATSVKEAGRDVAVSMGTAAKGLESTSDAIAQKIASLADALLQHQDRLATSATTVADDMAERMKVAGQDVASTMGSAAKGLVETSDSIAARITTILGGLADLDSSVKSQVSSMRQVVVSIDGAKIALDETADTWTKSSAPVVAAVEASRRIADDLTRAVDRVATVQRDMAGMAEAVTRISDKASTVWENYKDRFEQVDTDMQGAFDRFIEGARAFNTEVRDFMEKVDGDFAKGAKALSAGTEELKEIAETLVLSVTARAS